MPEEEGGNAILIEVFSPLRDKSVLENGTVAASHLLFLDSPFYSILTWQGNARECKQTLKLGLEGWQNVKE